MIRNETIRGVPIARKPPDPSTPRGAVAAIVWHLVPTKGMSYAEVSRMKGMSPATIARITAGNPSVGPGKLGRIADILGLPSDIFTLILDGDVQSVRQLDFDQRTKTYVLGVLDNMTTPRERRASDVV